MIMTFIARGMRSKKIVQLEHKLAMNLKQTQSKIWNEFNKEVNYLRRVFNELQLSKVKVSDLTQIYFSIARILDQISLRLSHVSQKQFVRMKSPVFLPFFLLYIFF